MTNSNIRYFGPHRLLPQCYSEIGKVVEFIELSSPFNVGFIINFRLCFKCSYIKAQLKNKLAIKQKTIEIFSYFYQPTLNIMNITLLKLYSLCQCILFCFILLEGERGETYIFTDWALCAKSL